MLENRALLHVADDLEKYGIASETEVFEVEQDDFSVLETLWLKLAEGPLFPSTVLYSYASF